MLAKGKAPKVPVASARMEPVTDSPEGILAERSESQGPYRLTAGKTALSRRIKWQFLCWTNERNR